MTIKDFAKEYNVSCSTINAYIRRNKNKFSGHLTMASDGKTRILDEIALALLKEQYAKHKEAIQIITPDPDAAKKENIIQEQKKQINDLIALNKQLEQELIMAKQYKIMLTASQDHVTKLEHQLNEQRIAAFENDKKAAIAEAKLIYEQESLKNAKTEIKEKNEQLAEMEKQLQLAEAEANNYVRTWFGLFKRKKSTAPSQTE